MGKSKKHIHNMDELPVFWADISDIGEKDPIRLVSLVKDPAIDTLGMYFSKEEISNFKFTADAEKKKVVGPAMIPNKNILRKDPQTDQMFYMRFKPETIEEMVSKFNANNNSRSINVDHSNRMVNGYIQQNWIIEDTMYDKSRMYGYNLPIGSWFLEVQIEDDEFWEKEVKELGKYSFSIEGLMGMKPMNLSKFTKQVDFIDTLTDDEVIELFKSIK